MKVIDVESLLQRINKLREAQRIFSGYTQEKVDEIFRAATMAANDSRIKLAKMAVEETKMGIIEDKVIKNHFSAEYVPDLLRRTVEQCIWTYEPENSEH